LACRHRVIAQRINAINESATVGLGNRVAEMKKMGSDVISFTLGEPDFPTPKYIIDEAIKALNEGFTHYTPSLGIPELREAIAEKTNRQNNIPCGSQNVIVTPTKYAVYLGIMSTINEGEEVIIPDPCWVTYEPCVKLAGGKPISVETTEEDNYCLTQEELESAVTSKTKMIILNTPSNPTGGVYSLSQLQMIAEFAKRNDLIVLSDEVYENLVYDGKHVSIGALDGMNQKTITVNGFSKAYAMTGWRLGWAVAPKEIVDAMNKIQQHTLTCVNSFAQRAGVVALRGDQTSVANMVDEFNRRREMTWEGIQKIKGISCKKPGGAFYLFPSFEYNMNSIEFSKFLLEKARVAVTPGSAFGKSGERHVRISYSTSRQNILEGLKRIKEAVSELS
jgi:aspartate aminotransferase